MWQKLNRIDSFELEKARIQLQNAIQLVCSGPRSYLNSHTKKKDWLKWNAEDKTFESIPFGTAEKVTLSLDLEQFVLSIYGVNDHIEHLVLSGITYPMAFGWLKVKLDTFSLDADLYSDQSNYIIEHPLDADDELVVTNQQVFGDLVVYYSNAHMLLSKLNEGLDLHGQVAIEPATSNMFLTPDKIQSNLNFGFSPGDKIFPEPYYFIQIEKSNQKIEELPADLVGIWNNKNWRGFAFPAGAFLNLNPEVEINRVSDFFNKNYWRLIKK